MNDQNPTFKFIEFNTRRKQRGAEAARVEVQEGTDKYWLWMSRHDACRNIMLFGHCCELQHVIDCYDGKAYREASNG